MTPFMKTYSRYYDLIYSDKNYEMECDFIEWCFNTFCKFKVNNILDFGCGTGNHALILAKRGYKVTGVDSSPYMIEQARKKSLNVPGIKFLVGNINKIKFDQIFDACIAMFAVIDYILTNKQLITTFKTIRKIIKTGGLLIFDFWYAPAVLHIKPSVRYIIKKVGKLKIIRIADPEFIPEKHINKTKYYLLVIKNGRVIEEAKEVHTVRYFFKNELKDLLSKSNFKVLKFLAFPEKNKEPNKTTWNAACIAKAI
jgi:SAM-dependent methyltransferase